MTHLPDITPEQALAVLLKNAKLQQGPKSRAPLLEAVIGIGKDHHAYIGLQQEDIDALAKVLEDQTRQQSPGSAQQTEARTVRTELKDGHVVALESYRPKQNVGGATAKKLREYAVGELAPFLPRSWSWLSRAKFVRWSLLRSWLQTVSASPIRWDSGSRA